MTRAEKLEHWKSVHRAPGHARHMRKALSGVRRQRFIEAHRDDPCWICGEAIDHRRLHPEPSAPTIDHVRPLSRGGGNNSENLRMAHARCNRAKGNLTLQEFKQALRDAARSRR